MYLIILHDYTSNHIPPLMEDFPDNAFNTVIQIY